MTGFDQIQYADLLTAIAYYVIPLSIGRWVLPTLRKAGVRALIFAFFWVAFILLCGNHHLFLALWGWHSSLCTWLLAIVSAITAVMFIAWGDGIEAIADTYFNYRELAYIDPLTKLPNRQFKRKEIITRLEQGKEFAVLFCDINRFKLVNDTYGHLAGDALLIEVGHRLAAVVGGKGFVSRRSGDEFVILLYATDDATIDALCNEIHAEIKRPFIWRNLDISSHLIGMAIGVAIATPGITCDELISNADAAMYEAKHRGVIWAVSHDSAMAKAAATTQLILDIQRAYENNEFVLWYQPIMGVRANLPPEQWPIIGYEGLTRWQHPTHGLLYPVSFIQAIRDGGFMVRHVEWSIIEAAKTAQRYPRQYFAINVPPDLTAAELQQIGAAVSSRLSIEITENSLNEIDGAYEILARLQSAGISLLLDDFGMGFSNLARTLGLPWDYIKIDRSMKTRPDLFRAIARLIRDIGAEPLLEGIEHGDEEILKAFTEANGYGVQGFMFSPAVPLE